MSTTDRDVLRREVLDYFHSRPDAQVRMSSMADELRSHNPALKPLHNSDFLDVVQPMIVTGKLSYAPGLKIQTGRSTK
jgi:hypothetical protein